MYRALRKTATDGAAREGSQEGGNQGQDALEQEAKGHPDWKESDLWAAREQKPLQLLSPNGRSFTMNWPPRSFTPAVTAVKNPTAFKP